MSFWSLLRQNLWFQRKAHLAVMFGVAVGAAVLAGALLVGDSLRGSLRNRAENQRAGIDFALVSPRFFTPPPGDLFAPARHESVVLVHGAALNGSQTASGITMIGSSFQLLAPSQRSATEGAILSESLAKALAVSVGGTITLRHGKNSAIPREALLGRREDSDTTVEWPIVVKAIIPDSSPAAQFRLMPGASSTKNIYVPLSMLQKHATDGNKVNAILVQGGDVASLQQKLQRHLTLNDWGLSVKRHRDYQSLESAQSIIDQHIADAVRESVQPNLAVVGETLVYLANGIGHREKSIPYSVVAALDTWLPAPLGPFLPPGIENIADDEIILADWPESPLRDVAIGDTITLTYFEPELREGKLVEAQASFRLRGRIPLTGVAADPNLTPAFPGVTDRLTIQTWDPPFEINKSLIKEPDETYWKKHRTTPKAYISLAAGQKLWGSRYGRLTSIRIASSPNSMTQYDANRQLLPRLSLEKGGFVWDDLRQRHASAGKGGQDFGGLFLGFSFFLIVAALLLVGLMARLGLERRATEVGLLLAVGWGMGRVRRLLPAEGLVVAVIGAFVGLIGAIAYAWLMIRLLIYLWPDQSIGSFLQLHVGIGSLAAGFFGAVLMSIGMLLWALRGLGKIAPSALLAGATQVTAAVASSQRTWQRAAVIAAGLIVGAVAIGIGSTLDNPMFRALSFFAGGASLLTAFLAAIYHGLKRERLDVLAGYGWTMLARLGARNAGRNSARSLLIAGLLASAAFLLVAVESFRRQPESDFLKKNGGSGGFPIVVETGLPVYADLNAVGRQEMLDAIRIRYQQQPDPEGRSVKERADAALRILEQANIFSARVKSGDDASCLNLYQAGKPRILGTPRSLRERGGFRFVASSARSTEQRQNPWRLLDDAGPSETVIPAIAEENTVTWMLKLGLGGEFTILDEQGKEVRLRIVAMLKDSVFQNEVLISEEAFARLYPREEGRTIHLVESPTEQIDSIANLMQIGLSKKGPTITRAQDRVAMFMAVENTYLTTFQLLGGFGLVLGALGLASAILRGTWERRAELALLRAVGFRQNAVASLVLWENLFLLALGLGAGIAAALLSVAPHVAAGGSIPLVRLSVLLGLVLLSAFSAALVALRVTLRVPMLPALRRE